jgi:hypothetical protein
MTWIRHRCPGCHKRVLRRYGDKAEYHKDRFGAVCDHSGMDWNQFLALPPPMRPDGAALYPNDFLPTQTHGRHPR